MSEQALDLKRTMQIVRRHWIAVTVIAALGLLAGAAFGLLNPPKSTSSALVVLAPATRNVQTEVVIAGSQPVLLAALNRISPTMSLTALLRDVSVSNPDPYIISITAQSKTDAQAEDIANAVAQSYVAYVRTGGEVEAQARMLESATIATRTSLASYLLLYGGLGALLGALVGVIGVLAFSHGDRRLRKRDEIANAIGVPVLASITVDHPTNPGRWARLLEDYEPSVAHAWQLRNALRYLGPANSAAPDAGDGNYVSVTVLSLSSDEGALALGPQLAVFATSLGIPTALILGPEQDTNATAALRAACAAPRSPKRAAQLTVAVVDDRDDVCWRQPGAQLTVVVAVVDGRSPRVADTLRTSATVLGISAGAATAAQVAGVAVSAADDRRQIDGILVADPDAADHTTGRVPQLARPRRRMPTRLTATPTETR